jgi:hypothetical protein
MIRVLPCGPGVIKIAFAAPGVAVSHCAGYCIVWMLERLCVRQWGELVCQQWLRVCIGCTQSIDLLFAATVKTGWVLCV